MSDDEGIARARKEIAEYDATPEAERDATAGVLIDMMRDMLAEIDRRNLRASCMHALAKGVEAADVRGLPDDERLILMRQNPGGNYYWTKTVAQISLAELRALVGTD